MQLGHKRQMTQWMAETTPGKGVDMAYIYVYYYYWYSALIGFGGLGVACWPLVPKFAGSNPAEAVGFLRAKKSPSEGK